MKKMKPNALYHVKFLDHCIGEEEGITVDMVGWYIKENEHCYIFSHWIVENGDARLREDNLEKNSILKAVILHIQEVKLSKSLGPLPLKKRP